MSEQIAACVCQHCCSFVCAPSCAIPRGGGSTGRQPFLGPHNRGNPSARWWCQLGTQKRLQKYQHSSIALGSTFPRALRARALATTRTKLGGGWSTPPLGTLDPVSTSTSRFQRQSGPLLFRFDAHACPFSMLQKVVESALGLTKRLALALRRTWALLDWVGVRTAQTG